MKLKLEMFYSNSIRYFVVSMKELIHFIIHPNTLVLSFINETELRTVRIDFMLLFAKSPCKQS